LGICEIDGIAREGEAIDEDAFRALIRAAVSLNEASGRAPNKRRNSA